MKSVVSTAWTDGQKDSVELGYIPLPPNVVDKVNKAARSDFMSATGAKMADDTTRRRRLRQRNDDAVGG